VTDDTCGYETADGTPCEHPACRDDGRCWIHTDTDGRVEVGRDSKLTKEREEKIAQAIENGKSITSAARMAGVSRNAVYSWLQKGDDQEEGVYADFHDRITRAKGHGEDFYFSLALELAKENEDSDEFGEEARRLLQYEEHLHRTAEITQELLEH